MDGLEDGLAAIEFAPETHEPSNGLAAAMERAHEALKRSWERDAAEMSDVYEISIPQQMIAVVGQRPAMDALAALKALNLSGSYKVRKGGRWPRES